MEEAIATKELKKEKNSGEKLYKFFIYLKIFEKSLETGKLAGARTCLICAFS